MQLSVRKQHVALSCIYLSTMVDHKYLVGRQERNSCLYTKLSRSQHTKLLCFKAIQ